MSTQLQLKQVELAVGTHHQVHTNRSSAHLLLDGDVGRDGLCLIHDFFFFQYLMRSPILSTAFFSVFHNGRYRLSLPLAIAQIEWQDVSVSTFQ